MMLRKESAEDRAVGGWRRRAATRSISMAGSDYQAMRLPGLSKVNFQHLFAVTSVLR
jgi:hypothetical protein